MKFIACEHCGNPIKTYPSKVAGLARRYCSFACRSAACLSLQRRRAEDCARLLASGMSRKEVAAEIGVSISTLYGLLAKFKVKGPRLQTQKRDRHPSWRGDQAGYTALHMRVVTERGKATACAICGKTGCRIDYANLTGRLSDVGDYAGMCRSCHTRFDSARKIVRHVETLVAAVSRLPNLPAPHVAGLLVEAEAAIDTALRGLSRKEAA